MNEKKYCDPSLRSVLIQVNHLVPGMELAREVVLSDGKVLTREGTVISRHTIGKLKKWQVQTVCVVNEVVVNPITDPKIQQFVNSYNKSVTVVRQAFDQIRSTQEIPLDTFAATATEITETVRCAGNIVDRLYDLPPCDDCTFQHSVNVSVIAALIATWLGYPPAIINAVSLAGLLHDVGKSQLPPSLLNLPYKLPPQDYDHYKKHAGYGYELINKLPELGQSIKAGVIQHHERTDGSGYPHRINAEKIHLYAKIVAVADLYDEALTVNREPSVVYSPYCGLEKLADEKYRLDPQICLLFVNRMLNYLSGNMVALSDGRQGRVVFLNTARPSRSMVQLADGQVLDLSEEETGLQINHVIR